MLINRHYYQILLLIGEAFCPLSTEALDHAVGHEEK